MAKTKFVNIPPMPEGLSPCNWTENAIRLAMERFVDRDEGGPVETLAEMCWRVAYHIANAETKFGKTTEQVMELAKKFYELMASRRFFPNAPTLYNAGRPKGEGLQLSACFVLPIEDSMEGIYEAIKRQAVIHKSGGGTGFSFSRLRPRGAMVETTRGKSSGPLSFLEVFNSSTASVTQGGTRRGANMAIMRVDHPDIMDFIHCKGILNERNRRIYNVMTGFLYSVESRQNLERALLETQIANFNISVAITCAFIEALRNGSDYDLINPKDGKPAGKLNARSVLDAIVKMAWKTGDPGLWFIDRTNEWTANPIPDLMKIEATNPCGEQPLFPNDVCNLGSLNLVPFVNYLDSGSWEINWENLERATRLAVRFLDNVIEINPYPLPEIMKLAHQIRRIGLGIMGLADVFIHLGIPYGSQRACDLTEKIMNFITSVGHDESEKLAEERGVFPLWDKSIYKNGKPLRNCTVTTIAPTGEISQLAGCSGGIEPLFGLTSVHTSGTRVLQIISPSFLELMRIAKARGFYTPELEVKVMENGHLEGTPGIPDDVRKIFVTAHEITPEWHIRVQAAAQSRTDNGVSKTINLPNNATLKDVEYAYLLAYELGCLGVTVFRDGCKGGVLSTGIRKNKPETGEDNLKTRPDFVMGATIRVETPHGGAFVTINFDEDKGPIEPFEIFLTIGKAGSDLAADAETIGRLLSMVLRTNSPTPAINQLKEIANQLKHIGGSGTSGFGKDQISSLADGIAAAIEKYLEKFGLTENTAALISSGGLTGNFCPQCGAGLIHEEGCRGGHCSQCDYSVC